jgi:hypothetical protein
MERMGDATLRELVYGKGAHVDPVACVEDISAELAARIGAGYPHSIWQIVEHMQRRAAVAGYDPPIRRSASAACETGRVGFGCVRAKSSERRFSAISARVVRSCHAVAGRGTQ